MTTKNATSDFPATDDVWRQIEDLVDQIAELSKADLPEEQFYAAVLDGAVRTGAAIGGAIWPPDQGDGFRLEHHINLEKTPLATDREARHGHQAFLNIVSATDQPRIAPPCSGGEGRIDNPTDCLLVACPVAVDGQAVRIVEVLQRPDLSPDAQRGYTEVITTLCGLAADYHRNQQLRRLRDRQSSWSRIERFTELAHDQVDLDATAYTLANEGRRLVDCDRLTVAVRKGGGYAVRAISGVDVVDRRANTIRQLEQLAHRVATVDEPLWYTGRARDLPLEVESAAQSYVDNAHTRSLAVVPLKEAPGEDEHQDTEPAVGVLVFEWFGSEAEQKEHAERVRAVCRHGTSAVANALAYDSIPLVRVSRRIRWLASRKRLPKLLIGLAVLVAIVAALVLVKADFYIQCRGQLQPKVRRKVFAPLDGQVERLGAKHGDQVASGHTLATLRSSDLEYEYTRVLGEIQTTTEKLNAAQASRLGANPTNAAERNEYGRLTAEEERLKKSLENLGKQKELLEDQQDRLEVRSPIPGRVLTWELTELLETRPVGRGQVLMTVAGTEGLWVLEVNVPDKHIGYVRQARHELKKDLDVTFVLATDPGVKHTGKVDKVAMITEPDETENLSVLVTIAFDRKSITNLHPGAGATARIRCGQRSLGYVWLHDLIEAVRARFFL